MKSTVSPNKAKDFLKKIMKQKLVPFIQSSPGCGKSDIVKSIAKELNLKLIDHRLSTSDPVDLTGIPFVEEGIAQYTPFNIFPLENTELPEGYDGWLLFLDEFNSAPTSVQAAAYRLVLDRQIGQHTLNDKCYCVAAGNLDSDGAIVEDLSTAMQSRLIHLELGIDLEEWMEWANENGIDYRIKAFIDYSPDKLHSFDPNHNDKTFQCPRTWHFLSKLIVDEKELETYHLPLLEGTIGSGAREFLAFCEIGSKLPTFERILQNPAETVMPNEPSQLYFLSGSISVKTKKDNIEKAIVYIERMPLEFQIICLRNVFAMDKSIATTKEYQQWVQRNKKKILDRGED